MTIREIETKSGLERASIRFYEQQGLLSPARAENGYRDYSQEDLLTLERVRFLRSLGFCVQEILAFQRGERTLCDALPGRIAALTQERAERERACRICEAMRDDQAAYQTLRAEKYLSTPDSPMPAPATDALKAVRSPWRRFFARMLDASIASTVFWSLFMLLFRVGLMRMNGLIWDVAQWVVWLLMLIALEPVCLHLFGTTPGKALMGLRVESPEGGRLSVKAARERAWGVLWYGQGANLPIYSLVRLWRSYRACADGEDLPWEYDSVLVERPMRVWRRLAWAGATALCVGAMLVSSELAGKPPCAGELTVAQFARNYNAVADYYDDEGGRLDEDGRWTEGSGDSNAFVIEVFNQPERSIDYDLREDGTIRRVTWRFQARGLNGEPISVPESELVYAAMAFAGANDFRLFDSTLRDFCAGELQNGSLQYGDTRLTRTLDGTEGVLALGNGLYYAEEGEKRSFTLELIQER